MLASFWVHTIFSLCAFAFLLIKGLCAYALVRACLVKSFAHTRQDAFRSVDSTLGAGIANNPQHARSGATSPILPPASLSRRSHVHDSKNIDMRSKSSEPAWPCLRRIRAHAVEQSGGADASIRIKSTTSSVPAWPCLRRFPPHAVEESGGADASMKVEIAMNSVPAWPCLRRSPRPAHAVEQSV